MSQFGREFGMVGGNLSGLKAEGPGDLHTLVVTKDFQYQPFTVNSSPNKKRPWSINRARGDIACDVEFVIIYSYSHHLHNYYEGAKKSKE